MELIDPKFTDFGIEDGRFLCVSCGTIYPVKDGVIDASNEKHQRGQGSVSWDRDKFEEFYSKRGYYETAAEWVQPFVPDFVQDYRYSRITGRILEWLRPQPGSKILYVGCGVGWLFFEILKIFPMQNLEFFGLDVVYSNIRNLIYRKKKEGRPNIVGIVGDAQTLPFPDDSFDIVVSSEVLEHIYDKQAAIKEIYRVLKPGGRFIFSTPSREAIFLWQWMFAVPRFLRDLLRGWVKGDLVYDEPMFRRVFEYYLKSAGFFRLNLEQNLFVPHECYFQYFPAYFNRLLVKIGIFTEKYLLRVFSKFGLHFVGQYQK
ncbi:MAG: methyltransferase domain-containing protein [Candidatus Brocadiia bacterium]